MSRFQLSLAVARKLAKRHPKYHLGLSSHERLRSIFSRLHRSSFVLLLGALTAIIAAHWSTVPQAQSLEFKATIKVSQAALPVTIGVPMSEAAGALDAAQLALTDPNGAAVPSQARVLARWRGIATETAKPIKWALVDFKPSVTGNYTLTRAAKTLSQPVLTASASSNSVRVATSRLSLEFPNQGSALLTSFQLDRAEQLRAPITVQMNVPRGSLLAALPANSTDALMVSDPTLLSAGSGVRFERAASIKWGAKAGSTQLVSDDPDLLANHTYRLDEGSARQEDIVATSASSGALTSQTPLKFNHTDGGTIRDLSVEQESATIKNISGQRVQFTAPLKQTHAAGDRVYLTDASLTTASATIDKASIEEANALRAVVRQDGHFNAGVLRVAPTIGFTLRYYIYADQPFIRVRLRLSNQGVYGFGASRTKQAPYAQHALIRSLSAIIPTLASGSGSMSVLSASDAHQRVAAKQNAATLAAGAFEIAVPEFAENFPKALNANSSGLRFDVLPETGNDYQFDGARAKTTDFYLGRATLAATALTTSLNATLEPAYAAQTGAIHPTMVEKRNWAAFFSQDAELGEAATRAERMLASAYAVEASDGVNSVPAQSIFEYRLRGEQGEHFGWRHFGDLAWGDGYANLHYDLPFIALREFLRTGDGRAFQLGGEMARFRADWGQYHADDYFDEQRSWNLRGLAFYEKGDHGSYREPVPSHTWIEGLWLYWALTGDESVRESAMEASEALTAMQFTYDSALSWNEPRWVGWPVLGLMAAWRYTGNHQYLAQAKKDAYLLVQAEEDYGKQGYFIPTGSGIGRAVQPFMWSGYAQLGVIEYWRETGDQRVADYLVRIADWLIGKGQPHPVLIGGKQANGNYQPLGTPYYWSPDKASEGRSVELGMMSLPVLVAAARISNRDDLRAQARQLFRDAAFFRDTVDNASLSLTSRANINFRSLQFPASVPKVYGHTGLMLSEFLADAAGSASPSPTPSSGKLSLAGLADMALTHAARASSTQPWPQATKTATEDDSMPEAEGLDSLRQAEADSNLDVGATRDAHNNVEPEGDHQDRHAAGSLVIVSAASYRSDALAPGSINAAFGTELITFPSAVADGLPLPLQLGGTSIEIIDSQGKHTRAPIFYAGHNPAGYDQINFYLPVEVAPGEATITVTSATGLVSECVATIQSVAPAIFTTNSSGSGEAVLISTVDGVNYEVNAARQDPNRDVYVVLFGTGWRQAGSYNATNAASGLQPITDPVVVEINHLPVTVFYAGPQPAFAGLDQINLLLPRELAPGIYPLVVRIGAQVSNAALIRVF